MAGMLNPDNESHRAITALTCSWVERHPVDLTLQLVTDSFDCWGALQSHTRHTTDAVYAKRHAGLRSYVTLKLLKMG